MGAEQLQALVAQHRTAVLGVAGAGVVGLALLRRKKAGGDTATSPAGTIPAAGVVPSSGVQGAFPNTTETNLYNSLLEQLQGQVSNSDPGTASAPKPIASTLFAPTGTGNYVQYENGTVAEIESDGSQLGLSWGQWQPLAAAGAKPAVSIQGGAVGQYYDTAGNLANLAKPAS